MKSSPLLEIRKLGQSIWMDYIRNLKFSRHLKTVAVGNEGRELTEYGIRKFRLDEIIDAFVASCYVHFRKPDADICRMALDISQTQPENVLYIDDRPLFIEVAQALGIKGLRHRGYESTRLAMESFGLLLPDKREILGLE